MLPEYIRYGEHRRDAATASIAALRSECRRENPETINPSPRHRAYRDELRYREASGRIKPELW
jgi:hypothetical protein